MLYADGSISRGHRANNLKASGNTILASIGCRRADWVWPRVFNFISRSDTGCCLIVDNPKCVIRRYWRPPPHCMTSKRHHVTGASTVSVAPAIASGLKLSGDMAIAFLLQGLSGIACLEKKSKVRSLCLAVDRHQRIIAAPQSKVLLDALQEMRLMGSRSR